MTADCREKGPPIPAENIHFDSDGCTLAGTYVQAVAPVAAALLITGNGRTDRDSDARLLFHQTLRIGVTKAIAVAGAALLSASAHTGEQTLTWQTRMLASRMPPATRLILRIAGTDIIRAQRKNLTRIQASSADVLRIQGTRVNACWLRAYAAYDLAPALARITVPVFAITGAADLQVPPEDVEPSAGLCAAPSKATFPAT